MARVQRAEDEKLKRRLEEDRLGAEGVRDVRKPLRKIAQIIAHNPLCRFIAHCRAVERRLPVDVVYIPFAQLPQLALPVLFHCTLRLSYQCRRRGVCLETAPPAAGALLSAHADDFVPQLRARAFIALIQLTV